MPMEQQYLTISEFARLRDININSLRYYEKLKLLTPERIDPVTRYRYYLPEQLDILDTILLCIRLGIPLKNLKNYIDEKGNLDQKTILENGRKAMQEQISEMQKGLELIQFNLDNIEQNQKYCSQKGIYTRRIPERFFIEAPFSGNWNDLHKKEETAGKLFQKAQARNMAPVFPAGVLVHYDTCPVSYSFFVQVLHPESENKQIISFPEADFLCMQIDMTPQADILDILEQNFDTGQLKIAILSNMPLTKSSFHSRHSELQVPSFPAYADSSLTYKDRPKSLK